MLSVRGGLERAYMGGEYRKKLQQKLFGNRWLLQTTCADALDAPAISARYRHRWLPGGAALQVISNRFGEADGWLCECRMQRRHDRASCSWSITCPEGPTGWEPPPVGPVGYQQRENDSRNDELDRSIPCRSLGCLRGQRMHARFVSSPPAPLQRRQEREANTLLPFCYPTR